MLIVYHLCVYTAGVVWISEDAVQLSQSIAASKQTTFAGLYCHEGQAYSAHNVDELHDIGDTVAERILNLADRFVLELVFISLQ